MSLVVLQFSIYATFDDRTVVFHCHITSYHIISKSQDCGEVSARNTRAPNSMQKMEKIKGTKKGKDRCFQFSWRLKVLTDSTRRSGLRKRSRLHIREGSLDRHRVALHVV